MTKNLGLIVHMTIDLSLSDQKNQVVATLAMVALIVIPVFSPPHPNPQH